MGRNFAAVVFSLGCLQASSALALGLGELEIQSYLNEPLKASVSLLNTDGMHNDEVRIRLGTREDFKRLGLERTFFLTSIQFDVVIDENGAGRIIMQTDDPVLEPYLDFIVEARWPTGRLLREYTVLVDPPAFTDATPVVSASQRVEEVEGIPAPGKKKVEAGASSGTRVDVRNSDLAPGEMPERDFNASAAAAPRSGTRYMIARDDTLWGIASRARPEGTSVHQTMLDIQRLNPDAFINNNINRVKAGYIIYLPGPEDISSADLSAAMAEVSEQNAAWRDGRDAQRAAASGPSLTISAEPEDEVVSDAMVEDHRVGAVITDEAITAPATGDADADARLTALSQQVQTLQRIVNLKDEQIAALQGALQESGSADADLVDLDTSLEDDLAAAEIREDFAAQQAAAEQALEGDVAPGSIDDLTDDLTDEAVDSAADTVDESADAEPAKPALPTPVRLQPEADAGIMGYLWYIVGGVVALLAAIFFWRRRSNEDEPQQESEDVFSEVELTDPVIAVDEEPAPAAAPAAEEPPAEEPSANRGYGERKHDAYASDLDSTDALAEADIYIAYGRHQQAIDLLGNAMANEPDNPYYRLKLLEIHTELGNRPAAAVEMEKIRASGNAEVIAQADELLASLVAAQEAPQQQATQAPQAQVDKSADVDGDEPGLAPNPLELMEDDGKALEADFAGLEIEDSADDAAPGDPDEAAEELDLSADFSGSELAEDDEELVIAADANGLSTKLDLARAYLDMGDEDGARQILDEVIAEGSDELKAEAQGLLDRIG